MSGSCVKALFDALEAGSCPKLKDLQLQHNAIGDDGMAAVADAFARGALVTLRDTQARVLSGDVGSGSTNLITSGLSLSDNPGSSQPVWDAVLAAAKLRVS